MTAPERSEYTVIPAARGTDLLEGFIDHEEGSEPYFRCRMVVGWRVSKSERFGLEAVIVGGPNVIVDEYSGEVIDNGDHFRVTVVRDKDGCGLFDDNMVIGYALREKMEAALRDSRGKHLARLKKADD
jgi:hypothetical protein